MGSTNKLTIIKKNQIAKVLVIAYCISIFWPSFEMLHFLSHLPDMLKKDFVAHSHYTTNASHKHSFTKLITSNSRDNYQLNEGDSKRKIIENIPPDRTSLFPGEVYKYPNRSIHKIFYSKDFSPKIGHPPQL